MIQSPDHPLERDQDRGRPMKPDCTPIILVDAGCVGRHVHPLPFAASRTVIRQPIKPVASLAPFPIRQSLFAKREA
jgi:hypothetical protein